MKKKNTLNNIKDHVVKLDKANCNAIKGGQHGTELIDYTISSDSNETNKGGCPPPFEEDKG